MAEAEAVILGLGRAKKDLEEELNAEYADKAAQEAAGAEARRQLDHMERQLAGALEAAEAVGGAGVGLGVRHGSFARLESACT